MTRASYFYIEATEPLSPVPVDQNELGIRVLPLEFSGVITGPLGGAETFDDPDQIDEVFERVEEGGALYVDFDDIWIPNTLFEKTPRRGDVFRVPADLFAQLYPLCRDDAAVSPDLDALDADAGCMTFSERETGAFARWSGGIVGHAKAYHKERAGLRLRRKEESPWGS